MREMREDKKRLMHTCFAHRLVDRYFSLEEIMSNSHVSCLQV